MNVKVDMLDENRLPKYDMSDNPTGCCPRFNPEGWNDRQVHFEDKLFVKAKTKSLFHVPLNMGRVFNKTFAAIATADAQDLDQLIVLSKELSPWSAEHLFAVNKDVPGQKMARLSGDYHTKVFEGPFSNARQWCNGLKELGEQRENESADIYFFYTTCPKCAKHYGKNYVVGFIATEQKKMVMGDRNF